MSLKFDFIKNLITLRRTQKFFLNLPKVILYLICLRFFLTSVHELCVQFLAFNTNILIRHENPDVINFPVVTICGCSETNVFCTKEKNRKILKDSVDKILNLISFDQNNLIVSCFFVYDSRTPELRTPCAAIEHPVPSLHDGRKCWTYFTILTDSSKRHSANYHQTHENHTHVSAFKSTEQYTWYIELVVNFTKSLDRKEKLRLQDSDVILSVHSPSMIPTLLDAEHFSLDSGNWYTMHFSKQVTRMLPYPYNTNCQQYYRSQTPRSKSECISQCLLRQYSTKGKCLNPNYLVTQSGLNHLKTWLPDVNVTYCRESSFISYSRYINQRRMCTNFCARDCEEEAYSVVTEYEPFTNDMNSTNSIVMIRPAERTHELIEHKSNLDFFQFVGYLGGHAHIWLGLSAIQLYDVVYLLIRKIRQFWDRFV